MRHARWLDHLPLWAVYGAVARTGIFEPWELLFMAGPLLAALVVEWRRWDLSRWRLPLELAVLAWTAFDLLAHPGFFGQVVRLLFLLGALRLALPRQPAQRRQILLMGFLLFLTTAISNADLEFFAWTLIWMMSATICLLQLAWEPAASLRGPTARPPFRLVPLWALGALALAGGFFLAMPRLNAGWRPIPSLGAALGRLQAGLSDQVDLGQQGPISANHDIVLRVVPDPGLTDDQRQALGGRLGYLRGITLERVQGQRWEPSPDGPSAPSVALGSVQDGYGPEDGARLELFLNPTPRGLVPLPYGTLAAATPFAQPLRPSEGGSFRLPFPMTRSVPLKVVQMTPDTAFMHARGLGPDPVPIDDLRPPTGRRLDRLLDLQPEHEAARRASLSWAPGALKARPLAEALAGHLRGFTYTLDNPSASAANPLADFLERTRAGHCEYFASALALMLRARGVPARVVNGYRLGAWVPEGGYWLVTQDEAHSWTEYWDEDIRAWRMEDGTPALAATDAQGWRGTWTRVSDALAFRWNRYVVRYSGEDQAEGVSALQGLAKGWTWSWKRPSPLTIGAVILLALAWAVWRFRPRRAPGALADPKGSRALAPLVRRTRRVAPPAPGETARAWLQRLARLRPERAAALAALVDVVDRALYGGGSEATLKPLVKAEARAWK